MGSKPKWAKSITLQEISKNGIKKCDCDTNWHGVLCNVAHDDCTGVLNEALCGHGTCVNVPRAIIGEPKYKCICNAGWTTQGNDPACTVDDDECSKDQYPCSVNPTVQCQNYPGSFMCGPCPVGYTGNGKSCYDINECEINNGGCSAQVQCINNIGSHTCGQCPPGSIGDGITCSASNVCHVNNGGCHSMANCQPNSGLIGRICTCQAGYTGLGIGPNGCTAISGVGGVIISCTSNTCVQGICQRTGNVFNCNCNTGWTGTKCDVDIDECANGPCLNAGTCVNNAGSYICTCTDSYTGINCEDAQESCGGRLTGTSGSFSFPSGSTQTYPHGVNCAWTITTAAHQILMITFTKFKVENHQRCEFDFLQINDGPSTSSHPIGKYCGSSPPNGGAINSTTNQLYFWFKSDESVNLDGFTVHWTSALPACGGIVEGQTHGVIASPGYPGSYPNNRDCVWLVKVSLGKVILFHFGHIALETHPNCSHDYLQLVDGLREEDSILGNYCSEQDPPPKTTTGPYARIRFHSDGNLNDMGFSITFSVVDGFPGCGGNFTTDSGILISPNYPNAYHHNDQCIWTITIPPQDVMVFEITNLDLEDNDNCQYDFLEVRAGSDETAPFIGRYCGSAIPPVLTNHHQLWIKFKADSSNAGTGFRATWSVACGGIFTNQQGELRSPYFPEPYPHNKECEYLIDQPAEANIILTFATFDIEASRENGCTYDYLEIRNGDGPTSPLIARYCGSSIPPPVISTSNQLWLKFGSDGSVANHGFRALYRVDLEGGINGGNIPDGDSEVTEHANTTNNNTATSCGGILTEMRGTFTSPSHPFIYPHGVNCTWYISVDPGFIIRLTFDSFHLEMSNGCQYDYVAVYDNHTDSGLVGRYCGGSVSVITSSNNMLIVKFVSDHSVTNEGFTASYIAINASSACGGELYGRTGIISSPGFPANYPPNKQCQWTIVMPIGQQVFLNITHISMEFHPNCGYDYLEIRNGGSSTSPLLGKYCGISGEERIFRSHSNRMYIKFKSDGNGNDQGFKIIYDGTLSGCGGELTSPTGSFVSPNYPLPYGNMAECFWTIAVSLGNIITIAFEEFDLERHSTCDYDYLLFRDQTSTGSLQGRFCGNNTGTSFTTVSNKVWIKFRTDYSYQGRGFYITYNTECNTILKNHRGVVESINFPRPYPFNRNCTYVIDAGLGNTINATFSHFELENHANCEYDYVMLRDGEDQNSNLIGRYCGTSLPQPIFTNSEHLYLIFVSDASSSFDGFRMEYFVNGCGGLLTGVEGTLSSPGYPNTYPVLRECNWRINVAPGMGIQLNITDFDMESHQNCMYDALEIYGGMDSTSPRIAQLCHTQSTAQVLTSTGNFMYLRFRSDQSHTGRGFIATFTAISEGCGGYYSTPSGTIMSLNYPHPYPHVTDCLWLIEVEERRTVILTFEDFDLEADDSCDYDYVAIYDGNTINDTRIMKSCNASDYPNTVRSTSNQMLVHMRSDASVSGKGFKAAFTSGCGGMIDAEVDGAIFSPNWPAKYEKANNCTWYIIGQHPGDRIMLTFTHMDTEDLRNCSVDFVQVLEGDDLLAPEIGTFCGNTVPTPIISQGSALVVKFVSDGSDERTGFRATYTKSISSCGALFTSEHGTFTSPGYPGVYPNNMECVWTVQASAGNNIMLSFRAFGLETSSGCVNDYVTVKENDNQGQELARYCGDGIPINMTVAHNMYVQFISNSAISGPGFMAQFNSWCTSDSGRSRSAGIHFFCFPRLEKARNGWIAKLKRDNYVWKSSHRLCSHHFVESDYERSPVAMARFGYTYPVRPRLNNTAIPSVFSFTNTSSKPMGYREAIEKQQQQKAVVDTTPQTHKAMQVVSESADATVANFAETRQSESPPTTKTATRGVHVKPDSRVKGITCRPQMVHTHTQTGVVFTRDSVTQTVENHTSEVATCAVQCNLQVGTAAECESCDTEDKMEMECDDDTQQGPVNDTDPDYVPETEFLGDDFDAGETVTPQENISPDKERKYIVFETCLLELFIVCELCVAPIVKKHLVVTGTLLVVTTECKQGHRHSWISQPQHKSLAWGNLLVSGAILFSGGSFSKMAQMFEFLHIPFISQSTYCRMQGGYLIPVIVEHYVNQRRLILDDLHGEDLILGGDGRCDSPGYCAKYGSYTLMDLERNKILDTQLVQSNEVPNSCHMELEGLKRGLSSLEQLNINVVRVVTDRHVQVKKEMRENHATKHHNFDVWHLANGVDKKLTAVSKRKFGGEIKPWIPGIKSHLYWLASSSGDDGKLKREKWLSILNHVTNIHKHNGPMFKECEHDELEPRLWLKKGSIAYKLMEPIITSAYLCKDIEKLSPLHQTYGLEVFHNVVLMFAPKHTHYFYWSMNARVYLAVLHYNENSENSQSRTSDGTLRYAPVYPKKNRGASQVIKPIKDKTTHYYIDHLMEELVKRRKDYSSYKLANADAAQLLGDKPPPLTSGYIKIDKTELIEKRMSRFTNR